MSKRNNEYGGVLWMVIGVILVIMIISFVVDIFNPAYGFFSKVDAGYVGIVTHFGKIQDKVLPAGFHITGFFEQVHPVNVRTKIERVEIVGFSSDIQQVTMTTSVNYNVTPEAANKLYRTVSGDYFETLVFPRVNENVKVVVSNYTAESLIANREALSASVLELMNHDLEGYGITVSSISIENIDFTDAFENAVEAKQVATQDAQKAKTIQDQQTMETTKAAERRKIEADAEAYETKVKAEAEAEANRKISESLTKELIDYIQAGRWDGKLPGTYVDSDSSLPIINADPNYSEEAMG